MNSNFMVEIAKRKAKTDGWEPCIFETVSDDTFRILGGVPIGRQKGGRPRWGPKKSLTCVYVNDAEIKAEEDRYESETGKCSICQGKGTQFQSWNINTGIKYCECFKCKGSGESRR